MRCSGVAGRNRDTGGVAVNERSRGSGKTRKRAAVNGRCSGTIMTQETDKESLAVMNRRCSEKTK